MQRTRTTFPFFVFHQRIFSAYVGGIDFNGDGTKDDLLPGSTVNAFNRGMGRTDLERLVAQFNQAYAGKKDAQGASIPRLTLPARYSFVRSFQSLDLRLSRSFAFRERWHLSLIGEVFNLYNATNLPATAVISPAPASDSLLLGSLRCSARAGLGRFSWARGSVSNQNLLANTERRVQGR